MKTTTKKILSAIMSFVLMLTMTGVSSITAQAAGEYVCEVVGGEQYTSLDEALAAVVGGQTIRLLKDVVHPSKIEAANKSYIIDVSGYKLTVNAVGDNCVSAINGQSITIKDNAGGGSLEVNGSGKKDGYGIHGLHADGDSSTITVTVTAAVNVSGESNIGVYAGGKGVVDAKHTDVNNTAGSGYVYGLIVYEGGTAHVNNIKVMPSGNWCIGVYVYGDVLSHGQTTATVDGTITADEYTRFGAQTVNSSNETLPTTKDGYRTYKLDSAANANTVWVSMTDAEKVAADKAALTFDAIRNQNTAPSSITGNLVTLPATGANGSAINWSSSDSSTVSSSGSVTRPANGTGDKTVTLTAAITSGAASDTVVFSLTVKEMTQTADATLFTLSPASLSQSGGTVTATVTGTNLNAAGTDLKVSFDGGTTKIGTVLSNTGTNAVIVFDVPENTMATDRTDTVTLYLNGAATVHSATVTMAAPVTPAPLQTPTISPNGGAFTGSATVTITGSGGTVYYTTDGSSPTTDSTQYTAPFALSQSATVNAAVYSSSNEWSSVAGAIFTIIASPSGGGSYTPTPATEPEPAAQVLDSNGNISESIVTKLDNSTGIATVEVNSASLTSAFDKSKADDKGIKTVEVNIPKIEGAKAYEPILPASFLTSRDAIKTIEIKTDIAAVTVPGNMLAAANAAVAQKASLTIAAGDKSKLAADVQTQVGSRPVIELNLKIDGKQTSWSNESAPVTVAVPYTPTAAELADPEHIVIWYIDGSGKAVSVPSGRYDPATGTVTFTTTHFSCYAVSYNQVRFKDVSAGAWYGKAVSFIAAREITTGTGNGNFSPESKLTRGQFIVMLMKAYGIAPDANPKDNFTDAGNTYYTGYLAAAKRLGISAGAGNNLFAPEKKITRQEMFTLLYNALKAIGKLHQGNSGKLLSAFSDAGDIAPWAKDAMTLLVETGTISGSGNRLSPKDTTTRAQMAQVLYNLLSK